MKVYCVLTKGGTFMACLLDYKHCIDEGKYFTTSKKDAEERCMAHNKCVPSQFGAQVIEVELE